MFVDSAKIKIKAGDGGNGAVAFHREKYIASGGPDGGDGGKGGDIIFVTDPCLNSLSDFRFKRKYSAENGRDGSGSKKNGKKGASLTIKVPVGTLIKEAVSGAVLADMSGEEAFICAKGGRGGWGNQHFATPTRQAPRYARSGAPGEEYELLLELKLIADVGLLGFPNVGKSTLLSVVSEAKPAVGNYHFTTLSPVLGVVDMGPESSFVMADIPGLIEGAGGGAGLGHEFLRHIERCRMLIHIVDISGSEGRNPEEDFRIINSELEKFNPELSKLPQIVAGNKSDLAQSGQRESFKAFIEGQGLEYFEITAPTAEGTAALINAAAARLAALPPVKKYEPESLPAEAAAKKNSGGFTVEKIGAEYHVEAPWLLKILNKTDIEDYEQLQYLQRVLDSSGIFAELERQGVEEGDTVVIYGFEFDFVP